MLDIDGRHHRTVGGRSSAPTGCVNLGSGAGSSGRFGPSPGGSASNRRRKPRNEVAAGQGTGMYFTHVSITGPVK
jgi:hypothetical protein